MNTSINTDRRLEPLFDILRVASSLKEAIEGAINFSKYPHVESELLDEAQRMAMDIVDLLEDPFEGEEY